MVRFQAKIRLLFKLNQSQTEMKLYNDFSLNISDIQAFANGWVLFKHRMHSEDAYV